MESFDGVNTARSDRDAPRHLLAALPQPLCVRQDIGKLAGLCGQRPMTFGSSFLGYV